MKATLLLFLLMFVFVLASLSLAPNNLLTFLIGDKTLKLHETLLATQNKIPTQTGKNLFLKQSNNLTTKVDPEIVDLDNQIISCDPNVGNLTTGNSTIGGSCVGAATTLTTTAGVYLGGQCCGAMMDTKEYHDHLKLLQSYKNIPDVPLNPHKTPIVLAQKWIEYDKQTNLTPEEQKVYDEAIQMSKEGPCCCQCWHYFVNKGIAKRLIKDYGYNSKQIDDYWMASDIC